MFHEIWIGFCQGLGFCLAIALTVGFTELRQFAKKNYDSNVLAWRQRKASEGQAAPAVPAEQVTTPVATTPAQPSETVL